MKLIKNYLSKVNKNEIAELTGDFGSEELANIKDAWDSGVSDSVLDAEVVTDEEGTLYDYRVFDPYHKLGGGIYTGFDGWSDWRNLYQDNEGNGIDTIFDEYDGETQD